MTDADSQEDRRAARPALKQRLEKTEKNHGDKRQREYRCGFAVHFKRKTAL